MKKIAFSLLSVFIMLPTVSYADDQSGASVQFANQEQLQAIIAQDSVQNMIQVMENNNFRQRYMTQILHSIRSAKRGSLPVEPMVNKVHEGIAKGYDDEAIAQAVSRVQERYERAFRHAEEITSTPEQRHRFGNTLAGAYAAGLKERECLAIMQQLQERDRIRERSRDHSDQLAVNTMETVRTMARMNVSSDRISSVVSDALKHSYHAEEMKQLQMIFRKIARDESAEVIASQLNEEINSGLRASDLDQTERKNSASAGTGSGSTNGQGAGKSGMDNSNSSSNGNSSANSASDSSSGQNSSQGPNSDSDSGKGQGGSENKGKRR